MNDTKNRCDWATADPLYIAYHDEEWGVPVRDEAKMFEFLLLETFQAGLSWLTILRKRENFRAAFAGFDAERVAAFTDADVQRLMSDATIVRSRPKILAAIGNARRTMRLRAEGPGLVGYFWDFVDGAAPVDPRSTIADLPASTPLSTAISVDMKRRGFRFVGPVVLYAHMQAAGLVNDHVTACYRHAELSAMR